MIGRQIADSVRELRPPVDGSDIQLTIDAGLQHLLEAAMWGTYRRNAAQGVTGVVMDVKTGAVLALATFPSYDANKYGTLDPEVFTNPAVSAPVRAGLGDEGVHRGRRAGRGGDHHRATSSGTTTIWSSGTSVSRMPTAIPPPTATAAITAGDVLKLSNNVGAAKIGLTLGRERLYQALRRFGFGERTGIEISGEASGVVWNPDGPNGSGDLTAAQNAFGQGLSVTAMQLVAGYAAIGNGGELVTPHVVAGWTTPDGVDHAVDPPAPQRIMREETADTVLQLLTDAVDYGIAQPASIPGYSVAGKTGTAQIAGPITTRVRTGTDAHGKPIYSKTTHYGYINGWIDSSFISLLPASDPQIVTLLLIHRPGDVGPVPDGGAARTTCSATWRPISSATWPSRRTDRPNRWPADDAARLGQPSRRKPSATIDPSR